MKHVEVDETGKDRVHNRKRLLINPQFQMSFLRYVLGIAGFTIAVFWGAKIYFVYQAKEYIASMGIPPEHMIFELLSQQSQVMDWIFLGATVVELAFLAFLGLRISNRVAGPVYRVTQDMLALAKGSAPRKINFRKGDYFPELADAYNQQLDARLNKSSKAG